MVQAQLIPTATVSIVDGVPCVSSRNVADRFRKQHKNVLATIRAITADSPKDFTRLNFKPSDYTDPTGRKLPAYNLTRDAFSLVVMGFTGKEALAWKIRYIEAFNAMEVALKDQQAKPRLGRPRKALPEKETVLIPVPVEASRAMQMLHNTRNFCRFEFLPKAYLASDVQEAQRHKLSEDLYKLQDSLWAALYNVCAAAEKVFKWS